MRVFYGATGRLRLSLLLTVGQKLSIYQILAPLGAGAMGTVWRAQDTRLAREVAIKVLPEEFAADEERLRRFEREARVPRRCSTPPSGRRRSAVSRSRCARRRRPAA
jgi:serine/threonine protein kinase